MAINFDKALGIHPQALAMREKRSEVLAANLANADTPGYKARDLDFKSILKQNLTASENVGAHASWTFYASTIIGGSCCCTAIPIRFHWMEIPSKPMSNKPNMPKMRCSIRPACSLSVTNFPG